LNVTESSVKCPFCRSDDTELSSLFGRHLLTVEYYCNGCKTPFEKLKGDDVLDAARTYLGRGEGE
jgi:DNA-directed RNA polymerase subunit RPC12/RpoP